MSWSRVTIDAAVLAASVRIQARLKSDIWTVVTSDDRFGSIAKVLRFAPRSLFRFSRDIDNIEIVYIDMQLLEAICRTP